MGVQDVIALSIAGLALVIVARFLWRTMSNRAGCAKGCGCSSVDADDDRRKSQSLKRVPLVTLNSPQPTDEQRPNGDIRR